MLSQCSLVSTALSSCSRRVMAAELVQLNPGTQVERWTISKKLGEGGFGAVYKVSDPTGKFFPFYNT